MAVMMGNLSEASIEGGASHDAAEKAAEEVADHQKQFVDPRSDRVLVKTLLSVLGAEVASRVIKTVFG